ncbi:MAG: phosphomethylpyrimidine synthase ThiC [candidate division WOR-3 bacterium]
MANLISIAQERIDISVLKSIAAQEGISLSRLIQGIKDNKIVILRSKVRSTRPLAIGQSLRVKVNANIGTSPLRVSLKTELAKLKVAIEAGADTVMDLSTGGDLDKIRRAILEAATVPVGSVPIYQAAATAQKRRKSFVELKAKDLLQVVEQHLADGVDFVTIHCGITKQHVKSLLRAKRLTGVVSRGGSLVIEWMKYNRAENPYYEYFDDILAMAKEYRAVLSLGDGLRPGSLHDATDEPQILELVTIGELVAKAKNAGVGVMVEGPGHIPLNQIEANVILAKVICEGAPFYVLGPLVTDISCGYDHIASAIGGALAAYYGADFLCYVTPSEHLGLPNVKDVYDGVMAAKIAAHAADVAKGIKRAKELDRRLSQARANMNWQKMIQFCLAPKVAQAILKKNKVKILEPCTMCGEFCAMKRFRNIYPIRMLTKLRKER